MPLCPVRWSLKNQQTTQPVPVADIHSRVGISVCMIGASWTHKAMALACPQRTTAMTALAGVRRRYGLDRHTCQAGFIEDELFQLEEGPVVPVLPRIYFRRLTLSATLADTR